MPGSKEFKSPIDTPQKIRLAVICALVALVTVGAVAVYIGYSLGRSGVDEPPAETEAASSAPVETEAPPTQDLMGIVPTLTIDEAREMALADAGVAESQADVSREALLQDNGIWVYEFRFQTEGARYEYKINANTGDVRSMVKETFVYPSEEPAEPSMPSLESLPPAESDPPASDAPGTVQSAAPAASQPPASVPPADTPAPTPKQSLYIGMDRAKSIALEHAELSASEVRFTHARMEWEHGMMVYEIEFRQGFVEYEYEIDAVTGRILDYERDAD